MLDAEKVAQKMRERGFTESMRSVDGNRDAITITFATMRLDGTDIACTVNLADESFNFVWCVPHSINKLSTPNCGSLFDDDHFNRLHDDMHRQAVILRNALK